MTKKGAGGCVGLWFRQLRFVFKSMILAFAALNKMVIAIEDLGCFSRHIAFLETWLICFFEGFAAEDCL